jgi:hypothetical protein
MRGQTKFGRIFGRQDCRSFTTKCILSFFNEYYSNRVIDFVTLISVATAGLFSNEREENREKEKESKRESKIERKRERERERESYARTSRKENLAGTVETCDTVCVKHEKSSFTITYVYAPICTALHCVLEHLCIRSKRADMFKLV